MTNFEIFITIIILMHVAVTFFLGDSDIKICKELNRQAEENRKIKDKEFMHKAENFKF